MTSTHALDMFRQYTECLDNRLEQHDMIHMDSEQEQAEDNDD
jgi:hypothetical protein